MAAGGGETVEEAALLPQRGQMITHGPAAGDGAGFVVGEGGAAKVIECLMRAVGTDDDVGIVDGLVLVVGLVHDGGDEEFDGGVGLGDEMGVVGAADPADVDSAVSDLGDSFLPGDVFDGGGGDVEGLGEMGGNGRDDLFGALGLTGGEG